MDVKVNTVEEVSATLQWIRMEYANKRNEVVGRITAREVEGEGDNYGSPYHKHENGPDREREKALQPHRDCRAGNQ